MPISNIESHAGPYYPDGIVTDFPFAFDLVVTEGAPGIQVARIAEDGSSVPVDPGLYGVIPGDQGGTVRFAAAPEAGDPLFILATPSFKQLIAFNNQAPYLPEVVTDALDRAAARDIYMNGLLKRAALAPLGETVGPLPKLAERKGLILGFDDSGEFFVNVSYASLIAAADSAERNRAAAEAAAAQANAAVQGDQPVKEVSGEYYITLADRNFLLNVSDAAGSNVYYPIGMPNGFKVEVSQYGVGDVAVLAAEGQVVNSELGYNKLAGQFTRAMIEQVAPDAVLLTGRLNGTSAFGWIESATCYGPYADIIIKKTKSGGTLDPSKLTLHVTTPGYSASTGSVVQVTEALKFNKWARKYIPDYQEPWELEFDGTTEYLRVWLEREITTEAHEITLDGARGWWTWNDVAAPAQAGVVMSNASVDAMPAPFGNWINTHRRTITNGQLTLEWVEFHFAARNNEPTACSELVVTDSLGATISSRVSTSVVSSQTWDATKVTCRRATIDISGMADGNIKADLVSKPWLGSATLDTRNTPSPGRGFNTRWFRKAAAINYVYVKAGGSDSTGVVSTTPATAEASPCATIDGALVKLEATGLCEGEVRVNGTGYDLVSAVGGNRHQGGGRVVVTRDPNVARSGASINLTGTNYSARLGTVTGPGRGCIAFKDITIERTGAIGAGAFASTSAQAQVDLMFEDVDLHNNGKTFRMFVQGSGNVWTYGVNVTQGTSGTFANTGGPYAIHRGLRSSDDSLPSTEQFILVGSSLKNFTMAVVAATLTDGGFIYCNKFFSPPGQVIVVGFAQNVNGYAVVQNLFEVTRTSITGPIYAISNDGAAGNTAHIITGNNTFTGAVDTARWNVVYDEGNTHRVNKLSLFFGDIVPNIASKSDLFRFLAPPNVIDNPYRDGNFRYINGVNCYGEVTLWSDGSTSDFRASREFPGQGSIWFGPGNLVPNYFVPGLDPAAIFKNYQGSTVSPTGVYTAGAGGGDYTLKPGVAPATVLEVPRLKFDLAGNARAAANDAAGCYTA